MVIFSMAAHALYRNLLNPRGRDILNDMVTIFLDVFPSVHPTLEEARLRNLITSILEVTTAMMINIVVIYVLIPCNLLGGYQQKIYRPTINFLLRSFPFLTH